MSGGKSLDQQALSPLSGLGNQSERLSTEHIIFPSLEQGCSLGFEPDNSFLILRNWIYMITFIIETSGFTGKKAEIEKKGDQDI